MRGLAHGKHAGMIFRIWIWHTHTMRVSAGHLALPWLRAGFLSSPAESRGTLSDSSCGPDPTQGSRHSRVTVTFPSEGGSGN